ncbi:hypothetical protein BGZ52_004612 [Haplosporangium bisporale]|nr:hypothetical protein BGZ52_004612 [Haplosporangium bisporale]
MKKYARLIRTLDFSCLDTNQFDIFMEIMVNNLEAEFTGVRTLKLANYDITHSDLLSILTRLPSLRALDIKHIKLKDSPSFSLFHLLSNFQQLDSLSLEFSKEDILEASSQDNLRPLSNLVELRLHLTGLAGSVSFLDLSIIPAQLPRLRVLDIKKVFVQEPTLTDLLVSTGHGLRELVLSGVPVHAEAMTRFGPYLNNLHKLDLSRAILRDYNGVIAAIQHCHSLRELTINSFSRKPVWEAVVRSCPELQAFHADHARHSVSSEALHHLGTLTRLERLCLLRCGSWSFEDLRWVLESFPLLDEFEFSRMDVSIPNHGWLVANAGSMPRASSHVEEEGAMEEQTTMPSRTSSHVKEEEGQISSGKATMAITTGLQSFQPLKDICQSFCGLHLYPNDPKRQVIAYHYCHNLDEDRYQCLMYSSDTPEAKLMGVEYIISEKLFNTLDANEKKYWHSHKYEIESGILVQVSMTLVPEMVSRNEEHTQLKTLVNTYGKIWQLWPVNDQGECKHVPTGPAQLLMAFTEGGQVNKALLDKRDKDMGISTEEKHKERVEIRGNPVAEGADQWVRGGKVWQVEDLGDKGVVATPLPV